jgi:hypothetical protein
MVFHALIITSMLAVMPVISAEPTANCEFRCKVRAKVCLSTDQSMCRFEDILPDETTGLCVFQSIQVAQDWINKQYKYSHIDWTLRGVECVAPDDNQT